MMGSRILRLTVLLLSALILGAGPVAAHRKEHHHRPAPAAAAQPQAGKETPALVGTDTNEADHMAAMMEEEKEDRSAMSTGERLLDWLGRLHPILVHFPLAFFPAALFTAIVGRRRPAFAKPVQFLVIAGGIVAPIAMLLGWFDGGLTFVDTDPLLRIHRWLGTAIGLSALALAIWAWRRPEKDRQRGMVWGLAALTAALVVQGWYGGAMIHGADHMNW
jgi:uncharacterized membrane protein